ncbi:MAG: bifunctional DNA-formamidopyrimidine glycosylase/DNA-(apurinic or apyrimidinic site) lyase [Hyphomicrobium sp.]
MPELPEVETVRRGLAPVVVGRRIVELKALRPDLRFPLPERFSERVAGQTVISLSRRAKYLVMGLSSADAVIMHLGMTGRLSIHRDAASVTPGDYVYGASSDPRHDHVVLSFEDNVRVVYNDPRRFGFMLMMPESEREAHALFRNLGVEPLGPDWTADYIARRARGKSVNLKTFVMDQRVVAGLGNIYASEALHRARLSPNRSAASLADRIGRPTTRAERLADAVRLTLERAILAGGSTLRDYRQADGASGSFQNEFAVYDRAGEKCASDGCNGVVRKVVHGGRATYFCGRCQA